MHKNRTTLIFSLSILSAILALSIFTLFFNIIKNKNEHTYKVLSVLDEKVAKKNNETAIEKKLTEIESTRTAIDSYFVDTNNIDSFVSYMESLGQSTGTDLSVTSVDVPTDNKNMISVKVSVKGLFKDVMTALVMMENAPYQIHVTGISLNTDLQPQTDPKAKPTSTWEAIISFNILTS